MTADSLQGKTLLVTGASSGIGRSCATAFARRGCRLLLAARRRELLERLAGEARASFGTESLCLDFDVRDAGAVRDAIDALDAGWRDIDVLVNGAGLSRGLDPVPSGELTDWDEMIDTNVKGLLYVTRAVTPRMLERGAGHVINIGSIAGREVYPNGAVYCASKFAVRAITQGLRLDLHGTPVRVTTIDPGLVETNFSVVRFHGDVDRARTVYAGTRPLTPDDVADAVVYAAQCPPHVTVAELVLLATDQASATRVHRRG